jgi:hypothetical protein
VRATRILIGRHSAHHLAEHPQARRRDERERVVERTSERQRELAE